MKVIRPILLAAWATAFASPLPAAKPPESADTRKLGDLSIEELMNETVTAASKREERFSDVAAAVTVLTSEELQSSGATLLPDALRCVPGIEVGTANSHQWAVSARGFNHVYSNMLLVLVDGRPVYTPLFGGVYWDLLQPIFADIERLEIVRGPGAAVWGANAVNGVINVVRRPAKDTQGTLVSVAAGDFLRRAGAVRVGGKAGENTYFRAFATYRAENGLPLTTGETGLDAWLGRTVGFCLDHLDGAGTQLSWQADATDVRSAVASGYNVNTVLKWQRNTSGDARLEIQGYVDRTQRDEWLQGRPTVDTFDTSVQYTLTRDTGLTVAAGGEIRWMEIGIVQTSPAIVVRQSHADRWLTSAFAQAEQVFQGGKLAVTGGVKLERTAFTGTEVQPTVRFTAKPTSDQTIWAAVSRAVRTPGEVEASNAVGITLGPPIAGPGGWYLPTLVGNSDLKSEVLLAFEAGFRTRLGQTASLDVAVFYNDYDRLIAYRDVGRFVPGTPFGIAETPWQNSLRADSYGSELSVTFAPQRTWRIVGGYTFMNLRLQGPEFVYRDLYAQPTRHQASVDWQQQLGRSATSTLRARYSSGTQETPEYLSVDARLAIQLDRNVELALVGQNLFDPRHREEAPLILTGSSEVPRAFYGQVTVRF